MSEMYKIFVTNVINPDKFFAQIGTPESFLEFSELEEKCTEHVENLGQAHTQWNVDINDLEPGLWVLAYSSLLNRWRRAQVKMVTSEEVDVNFVDYEFTEMVTMESIVTVIPDWVSKVPPMVFRCKLAGIRPIAKTYINRATYYLTDLVQSKLLDAKVLVNHDSMLKPPYHVDILVTNEKTGDVHSVGDLLKHEGLAMELKSEGNSPQQQTNGGTAGDLTRSPFQVPEFDQSQLLRVAKKKEETEPAKTTSVTDIEQQIFTRGLGQKYEQHQDSKINPLRDPGDSPISGSKFFFNNISQQLAEMKNANTKVDKSKSDHAKESSVAGSHHSPVSTRQLPSPRAGLGRGAPPPASHDSEPRPGDTQEGSSPPLRRKKSPTAQVPVNMGRGVPAYRGATTQKPGGHSNKTAPAVTEASPSTAASPVPVNSSPKPALSSPASGGPAPRFAKQKLSPQNHAQRLAARRRNSTPDRDKVQSLSEREKRSEYEWQADQFCFKVKEALQRAKDNDFQPSVDSMKKLVYPANSKLENLPGKKELHLCIKTIASKAVEEHEKYSELGPAMIQEFRDDPDFNCSLSEVLWALQGQYVRVMTSKSGRQHVDSYCRLLAQVFLLSSEWEDSTTINTVMVNSLDKWAMYNRKNTAQGVAAVLQLFVDCLLTLITLSGRQLLTRLPSETNNLFSVIQDRAAMPEIPSGVREKFEAILDLRKKWEEEDKKASLPSVVEEVSTVDVNQEVENVANHTQNSGVEVKESMKEKEAFSPVMESEAHLVVDNRTKVSMQQSNHCLTGSRMIQEFASTRDNKLENSTQKCNNVSSDRREIVEGNLTRGLGRSSRKSPVMTVYVEKAIQTEAEYPPACTECSSLAPKVRGVNKFERVREMLHDLDLEEFLETFQEMGIRDTVLDLDFSDLKDLLKECGVRPGQVMEIKTYIKTHPLLVEKSETSSSSTSHYCDTTDRIRPLSQDAEAMFARIGGERLHNDLSKGGNNHPSPLPDTPYYSDDENVSLVGSKEGQVYKNREQMSAASSLPQRNTTQTWVTQSQNILTESTDVPKVTERTLITPHDFELSTVNSLSRQPAKPGGGGRPNMVAANEEPCGNISSTRESGDSILAENWDQGVTRSESREMHNRDKELESQGTHGMSIVNSTQVLSTSPTPKLHPTKKYDFSGIQNMCKEWIREHSPPPDYGSVDASVPSSHKGQSSGEGLSRPHPRKPEASAVLSSSDSNYYQMTEANNNQSNSGISSSKKGINEPVVSDMYSNHSEENLESVVSPSSYMPPSPQGMSPQILPTGASNLHFPSIYHDQSTHKEIVQVEQSPEKTGIEEGEGGEEGLPGDIKTTVLSPLSQRIANFGRQQPMCSLCGERGTHRSHECPDKMKKLFL